MTGAVDLGQHQPEIHEHDPPGGSQHHVARLHVAVREARAMHDRERVGHGDEQLESLGDPR